MGRKTPPLESITIPLTQIAEYNVKFEAGDMGHMIGVVMPISVWQEAGCPNTIYIGTE